MHQLPLVTGEDAVAKLHFVLTKMCLIVTLYFSLLCPSAAPVRHMAFGIPGGSTNMTYFVLCGGGLTAAVVYVSITVSMLTKSTLMHLHFELVFLNAHCQLLDHRSIVSQDTAVLPGDSLVH